MTPEPPEQFDRSSVHGEGLKESSRHDDRPDSDEMSAMQAMQSWDAPERAEDRESGYTEADVRPREFRPHLRRLVDFCCDRYGCGHHVDGHGHGERCYVPGCKCVGWRDHVNCDHGNDGADDAERAVAEALKAAWQHLADDPVHADQLAAVAVRAAVGALAAAGRLLPPDTRTEVRWGTRLAAHGEYHEEISEVFGEWRDRTAEEVARHRAKNWARRFGEDLVTVVCRKIHNTPWLPVDPPADPPTVPEKGEDRGATG